MLFSIVTVCRNSEGTIGDTLRSVSSQDFGDYEHIIVDGASSDGTVALIAQHAHARLSWKSEPDKGLYDAMNKGLRRASGDYVLFLNSDDYLRSSDVLSLVADRITQGEVDCVFADTEFVKADGITPANRIYSARNFKRWWLRIGVMPPHPSMFVRRDTLRDAGGFDTGFRIAADFDLIARLVLRCHVSWTSLPIVTTRFRVGGVSTQGLSAKLEIGREFARSLKSIGQPLATLAVQLRYAFKATQLRW